ncbi:MAG: hypothetical protein KDD69_05375 [Bdellovibrionales bacterium]|nr:hypothetical protein [Bdellovibrionales bacterium]
MKSPRFTAAAKFHLVGNLVRSVFSLTLVLTLFNSTAHALDEDSLLGMWNGYLSQQVILECSNASSTVAEITVDLFKQDGSKLTAITGALAPNATRHFVFDRSLIADSYGTFSVASRTTDLSLISCRTMFYRGAPLGHGEILDYAYALPVTKPMSGKRAGMYNSMNPEIDGQPVFNWFTLYNASASSVDLKISLFQTSGSTDTRRAIGNVTLAPKERRDYALGHDVGKETGTYVIEPSDNSAPYVAHLIRYGIANNRFSFAFPLHAQHLSCEEQTLPASTMDPATNWLELANPSDSPTDVAIDVFSSAGTKLHSEVRTLAPFAQSHLYVNAILGEKSVGTIKVSCVNDNEGILAQSLFYGHPSTGTTTVEWAYASQGVRKSQTSNCSPVIPVNTYLGAANWLAIRNGTSRVLNANIQTFNLEGASAKPAQAHAIAANGRNDIALHDIVDWNFAGFATFNSTFGTSQELLRVYPREDGTIGAIVGLGPDTISCIPTVDEEPPVEEAPEEELPVEESGPVRSPVDESVNFSTIATSAARVAKLRSMFFAGPITKHLDVAKIDPSFMPDESYLGMQTDIERGPDKVVDFLQAMGVKWLRTALRHDDLPTITPRLRKHKFNLLLNGGSRNFEGQTMTQLANTYFAYNRAYIAANRDIVKAFQIWNEPFNFPRITVDGKKTGLWPHVYGGDWAGGGWVEPFGDFTEKTADLFRTAFPGLHLLGGTKIPASTIRQLQQHPADLDGVYYQPYPRRWPAELLTVANDKTWPNLTTSWELKEAIPQIQAKTENALKAPLDIWITETGARAVENPVINKDHSPQVTYRMQAVVNARTFLSNIEAGVLHTFPFLLQSRVQNMDAFGFIDRISFKPRPVYFMMARLNGLLGGYAPFSTKFQVEVISPKPSNLRTRYLFPSGGGGLEDDQVTTSKKDGLIEFKEKTHTQVFRRADGRHVIFFWVSSSIPEDRDNQIVKHTAILNIRPGLGKNAMLVDPLTGISTKLQVSKHTTDYDQVKFTVADYPLAILPDW